MAVTGTRVTVSSSAATAIATAAGTDQQSGAHVLVRNADASISIDLGGSAVNANGFTLIAGASVSLDLQPGEVLYGRAASGTPVVHVLKSGA